MKQHKKKIIVVLLLLIGGGFWYYQKTKVVEPETVTVTRGTVEETVSLTGFVEPATYADLSFISSGKVADIKVTEGQVVAKGDLLMTLDNPVVQAQYNEAALSVSLAESQEKLARRQWENLKPEEREAKKLSTQIARAGVQTAGAQFVSSRVVAPFSGTITLLDVRVGETVSPGKVVARIQEDNELIIRANVSETEVAKLQTGLSADVTFEALSDEVYRGELLSLSQSALLGKDVVTYEALLSFDAQNNRLRDGMTADIEVVTNKVEKVLVLPARALKRVDGVYTVDRYRGPKEDPETVTVTVGLEGDNGEVEITGGLEEGDKVITGATQEEK